MEKSNLKSTENDNTTSMVVDGENVDAIHCLTIPLHDDTALLPNAAVAEIVAYSESSSVENTPDWLLGLISWRDKQVPLVSLESVNGNEAHTAIKNSRIAVLNTLNGNEKTPYIAVLSQGIPSVALVQENGLEEIERESKTAMISAVVQVGGIEAIIPNIDEIEKSLLELELF